MTAGVVELRQYELVPGRREELIELFDGRLVEPQEEVAAWEPADSRGLFEVAVRSGDEERDLAHVADQLLPALARAGGTSVAVLVTEPAPNGFPALPVRTGERVVVTVFGFDDADGHARYRELIGPQDGETELLRLEPTVAIRR